MIGFLIMLNVILIILSILFLVKLKKIKNIRKSKIFFITICIVLSLIISLFSLYTGLRISSEKIILEHDLYNNQKSMDINKNDYKSRVSLNTLLIESLNDINTFQNKLTIFTLLSFISYLIGFFYDLKIKSLNTKHNT